MNVVAAVLLVLSGLFYAADHNEIGELGTQMCRYGGAFWWRTRCCVVRQRHSGVDSMSGGFGGTRQSADAVVHLRSDRPRGAGGQV